MKEKIVKTFLDKFGLKPTAPLAEVEEIVMRPILLTELAQELVFVLCEKEQPKEVRAEYGIIKKQMKALYFDLYYKLNEDERLELADENDDFADDFKNEVAMLELQFNNAMLGYFDCEERIAISKLFVLSTIMQCFVLYFQHLKKQTPKGFVFDCCRTIDFRIKRIHGFYAKKSPKVFNPNDNKNILLSIKSFIDFMFKYQIKRK